MRLFKKKRGEKEQPRYEFSDIPIGSMIEMSDTVTFDLEDKVAQTYSVKAYKKYEAEGFLRYMYQLENSEEVILGVDFDPNTGEYDLGRFVWSSEEEFTEPLGDTIVMDFDDPEKEGETIQVEYYRSKIINTKMTLVEAETTEEYDDVELHEYESEDGELLTVELWNSWFTFFLGEVIDRADVEVYPVKNE